jgi:hypothetical protein
LAQPTKPTIALLIAFLCGAGTCLVTAIADVLISRWTHFDLFSLSFFLVIPAGATLIGGLAASGAVFACKYFNLRPRIPEQCVMMLVAACAVAAIYYFDYETRILADGRRASDVGSFGQYVTFVVFSQHMFVRNIGDTGAIGVLGYPVLFTRFLGLLAGGVFAFERLLDSEQCSVCGSYLKKTAQKTIGPLSSEESEKALSNLRSGRLETYRDGLAATSNAKTPSTSRGTRISITLWTCPQCHSERIIEEVEQLTRGWHETSLTWHDAKLGRWFNVPTGTSMRDYFE